MHGTHNESLLIDSSLVGVKQLSDNLRNKDYKVMVRDGNSAQLCVLCHDMNELAGQGASGAGNGLSGVHAVDGDCGLCHSHGQAVQTGL